ncbi:MAG TPA: pyridoxamine 5'-phosphate oxidase family protein [Euzebyales bacterium]
MERVAMPWSAVVEAATASGWTTYVGTADAHGRPHVAVVAPGFADGTVWFATRASSKKCRNLRENSAVAFHWPIQGSEADGELAAWGTATVHDGDAERHRLWDARVLPYDLSGFFGSAENPDLVFVEVTLHRARLQTQRGTRVWSAQRVDMP